VSEVVNPPTVNSPTAHLQLAISVPREEGKVNVCLLSTATSKPLLSFVHLSDIQLRDPTMILTDRQLSATLDRFDALSSMEYDPDLAQYNEYMIEAVFATINAMSPERQSANGDAGIAPPKSDAGNVSLGDAGAVPSPGVEPPPVEYRDMPPQFVVHTGDSIDSGSLGELSRIHVLMHRLKIPFFQGLGNHDVLVFGNLTPTNSHDSDKTCTNVWDLLSDPPLIAPGKFCVDQYVNCSTKDKCGETFVAGTSMATSRQNFIQEMTHPEDPLDRRRRAGESESRIPLLENENSRAHGFDLGPDGGDGHKTGYYAFGRKIDDQRVAVSVVLNSEDFDPHQGGTAGRIQDEQLGWLIRLLDSIKKNRPRDLVLVFAHHPLNEILVNNTLIDAELKRDKDHPVTGLRDLLAANRNVVGFFYGHHHRHSICGDLKDGTCQAFWEVETASLLEFPQEGRLVRIKQFSNEIAFFELTALREHLSSQDTELAHNVTLARNGAERDYCFTHREDPQIRCSEDRRPYRMDGRDANARLFFALPRPDRVPPDESDTEKMRANEKTPKGPTAINDFYDLQ